MKLTKEKFFYLFRKYPLLRAVLVFVIIAILLFLIFTVSTYSGSVPVISAISPQSANPGDVLTIYGQHFGTKKTESYVEIGGRRITASSYIDWENDRIMLKIPQNVQDGLVFVSTTNGKSEPKIFTNKNSVPVSAKSSVVSTNPGISSIEPKTQAVGGLITITGTNFGIMRNDSRVMFSWKEGDTYQQTFIPCSDSDYEYWSDQIIKVRVPDGASSGTVTVVTAKGKSPNYPFNLQSEAGTKTFSDKRIYATTIAVEVQNLLADADGTLVLRVPKPITMASQPEVEISSSIPDPSIPEVSGTIVHNFDINFDKLSPVAAKHTFVVSAYSVSTQINEKLVKVYSATTKQRFSEFLKADTLVKSDNEDIIALAKKIIGKEKNPYIQARLIYQYMLKNYTVDEKVRSGEVPVTDLLTEKHGDAYDFALVYCALLRVCGIPAVPVAGLLVKDSETVFSHWWNEFYVENFGWVPVDCAAGAGYELSEALVKKQVEPAKFYFGSLDSRYIAFSRGLNQLRPASPKNKIVYKLRTYAFQTIWEESSENITAYSSFWTNPLITGIY